MPSSSFATVKADKQMSYKERLYGKYWRWSIAPSSVGKRQHDRRSRMLPL